MRCIIDGSAKLGDGEGRRMPLGENLESTDHEVMTGAVTRRSFLRRTMVLGVSAPALLAVLAACGEDEEEVVEEEVEEETTDAATEGEESTDAATDADEDTEDAEDAASPAASPAGASASPRAGRAATPMGSPSASPVGGDDDEATPTT